MMTRDEAKRHLEAVKLMLLRPDGHPVSDLYDAICVVLDALDAAQEIVKCKECENGRTCKDGSIYCIPHNWGYSGEYYCAWGQRKEQTDADF